MNYELIDPNALYIYCDGAMDYDSKNTGGVGIEIVFPESIDMESIKESIGKYVGANIERLELEGILQGMNEVLRLYDKGIINFKNIKRIIIKTDRYGLNDKEKTNAWRIREWRRNKWHNHEGKAIKNSDLLDKVDKTRKKIIDKMYCRLEIRYGKRKFNKVADKLAKKGKKEVLIKDHIALKGLKLGKRKYGDIEIENTFLKEKEEYIVHVYKKEPVRDQWEICVEFYEGDYKGKILKIYSDFELERKLHRHHIYRVRIKNIFTHHVTIFKTISEIKHEDK